MKLKSAFLILIVFFISLNGFSQSSQELKTIVKDGYDQAMHYKEILLFGESIGELDKVIYLSKKHGFEKDEIKASIAKAEIFRKTENFNRGIKLLYKLRNTEKYPRLHVQKLGRLAALYSEYSVIPKNVQRDTIKSLVKRGIDISVRLNLKGEEAGLRNELGFSQSRNKQFVIGLQNLKKSRDLYHEIKDRENEMGAQINILDLYVSKHDFRKCDSLYPILTQGIKDKKWFALESKLFSIISIRYKSDNEMIRGIQWADKANKATVSHVKLMNTNQMASFKVIHDTNKFKEESLQKSNALEQSKNQRERLLFLISILILIIVIVILIFFRVIRLKSKLNVTVNELNIMNGKHEMLIIESNHRIKNNLQMIISMLEFTRKGLDHSDTDIIKSMSGKIQTISALHKHLYVDIHNEHVDLGMYFNEILKHYKNIGLEHEIDVSINTIQIRSERIVYFGLILNEMLSNTLEHGKSEKLELKLRIEQSEDHFLFEYSDYSPHPISSKEGTGTKLIKQLVNRIKGTEYQIDLETGTYKFKFNA